MAIFHSHNLCNYSHPQMCRALHNEHNAVPCTSYFVQYQGWPAVIFVVQLMKCCISSLSQLATHKNAVGVAIGASIGHTICTSLAVIGGSILASKISQRTVATIGGLLFLGFSLSSYFYPPLWSWQFFRMTPPAPTIMWHLVPCVSHENVLTDYCTYY